MTLLEAQDILFKVSYKNAKFYMKYGIYGTIEIRMVMQNKDAEEPDYPHAPYIPITLNEEIDCEHFEKSMTPELFKEFIYNMCKRMELHELNEFFKIDNRHYKDPHPEKKRA